MNLRSKRRVREVKVDMTPLIDVVFLLLIFFMVSTTFDKQTQLKVDLPTATPQAEKVQQERIIALSIDAQGRIYIDNQALVAHDTATIEHALRKQLGQEKDLPIVISSDRQAPFEAVMRVMDAAARLNLGRLSFVARADEKE